MLYPDYYPKSVPYLMWLENWKRMGLTEEMMQAFYDTLMLHITYVQEAGDKLGVPAQQLKMHDISKFSSKEFFAYAKHFHGGGAPDEFALAWLHHTHKNNHHWEHWMFPDLFSPHGSQVEAGVVPMPDHYALEMIADWMGAGKAYTGEEDMSDWLWKNIPRISLHSKTATFVRETLRGLGYGDVLSINFRSEVLLASHNI